MRDPNRIDEFLKDLGVMWKNQCPDWRFGQLIFNVMSGLQNDGYYLEDSQLIEQFKHYFNLDDKYFEHIKRLDDYEDNWFKLKSYLRGYLDEHTPDSYDRTDIDKYDIVYSDRYCVALSIEELLDKMDKIESENDKK